MRLIRVVLASTLVLLAACAQTPAKVARMSENGLHAVPDDGVCRAVNSSTRSQAVVAEVRRRGLGCDNIVNHCLGKGHANASPEFGVCVAMIEQRWEKMRLEHERQEMARVMARIGDPLRRQRMGGNVVCRLVPGPDGRMQQVCTSR